MSCRVDIAAAAARGCAGAGSGLAAALAGCYLAYRSGRWR